jgi:hypothetical protein
MKLDVKLIRDTYLQIHNTRITTRESGYLVHFLYSFFVTGTPQYFNHCNNIILLSHSWYNNLIIRLYFNCAGEASSSVIPFCITVTQSDDGRITGRNMS